MTTEQELIARTAELVAFAANPRAQAIAKATSEALSEAIREALARR